MKEEINESIRLTNKTIYEDEAKELLISIDSTLLYILIRAEENQVNLTKNYDLPVYYNFNYSSENVGNFSQELFNYLNVNNIEVLNFEDKRIDTSDIFIKFLMTEKLSITENYLFFLVIKNKIRQINFESEKNMLHKN